MEAKGIRKIIALAMCIILACSITGCGRKEEENAKKDMIKAEDDEYRTYYEIFVYSFNDSNNDGIGDLNGVTEKLDYIEDLGFNGIWLMPIMPSSSYHKYNIDDYYDIDREYGTLDDFKRLVGECHERGINIIIDMVFNHTSSEHQWFKEAADYLKSLPDGEEPASDICKYVDYYNFEYGMKGVSGYSVVEGTNWYYESMFSYDMPDLNLDNAEVRKEIEDITDFWLGLGVDGFRLDAAKEYFSGNSDKNIEVLNWYSNYVKSVSDKAYVVAEVWDSFTAISSYYKSGITSIFNYAFGNSDGQIIKAVRNAGDKKAGLKLAKNLVSSEAAYKKSNPDMIDAPFLSNHDTGRIAGFVSYDENLVKLAGAINLFMSGNVFVYYGEELGMSGSGRDENKRAPMYWSDDENKLTTPPPNMETVEHHFGSAETQAGDEYSIYNYYRNAMILRNSIPEIARGTYSVMEGVGDGDICAVSREYNGNKIYMLFNISGEDKEIVVDKASYDYSEIIGSLLVSDKKAVLKGETVKLPAYAVVILK